MIHRFSQMPTEGAKLVPAGSEAALRKLTEDRSGAPFLCAHTGASMSPTLCALDLLEVVPYGNKPVKVGDVVLFLPPDDRQPGGRRPVVHRLMAETAAGFSTGGDNCPKNDPWLLGREQILGRVTAAWRGVAGRPIAGGYAGLLRGRLMRYLGAFDRMVSRCLHPLYHGLARANIACRLLPSRLKPRVVLFQRAGAREARLMVGGRLVGSYDAQRQRWFIRRPFLLFIDRKTLRQGIGTLPPSIPKHLAAPGTET